MLDVSDNEVKQMAVHRSSGIYLSELENRRKRSIYFINHLSFDSCFNILTSDFFFKGLILEMTSVNLFSYL
jgi:hypothetical protein